MIHSVAVILILMATLFATARTDEAPTPVELRLAAEQGVFELGGAVKLRVEILNTSKQDFPVGKDLHPTVSSPSYVLVSVEDVHGNVSPGRAWTQFFTPEYLGDWWIYVRPRYFYGAELILDNTSHAFLGTVGRYCATARYVSKGDAGKDGKPTWRGEIKSNMVCFEVRDKKVLGRR